jgi:hypothetical protein
MKKQKTPPQRKRKTRPEYRTNVQFGQQHWSYACSETFNSIDHLTYHPPRLHQFLAMGAGLMSNINQMYWVPVTRPASKKVGDCVKPTNAETHHAWHFL